MSKKIECHKKPNLVNPIYFLLSILFLGIVIFVAMESFHLYYKDENLAAELPSIEDETQIQIKTTVNGSGANDNTGNQDKTPPANATANTEIPRKKIIKVPFTTQAPLVNWDETHEEACEEASLIMVKHFLRNTNIESPESADKEILDLIHFEEQNNYQPDVTTTELNEIARKYYGINSGRVQQNISIDDIKREVAAGKPVIVPAAGKILPNPNFRNGGPVYHMLVIRGYDADGFTTNDPGTRKGEYFRYSFEELYNAIHDWDPDDIMAGGKNMLVFD